MDIDPPVTKRLASFWLICFLAGNIIRNVEVVLNDIVKMYAGTICHREPSTKTCMAAMTSVRKTA
jgi:hypothetical protein